MTHRKYIHALRNGSYSTKERLENEFVVVNWNVQRGQRFAKVVSALLDSYRPDICLLQEVDMNARRTGFRDIPRELAETLSMNFSFGVEFEELSQRGGANPALHGNLTLSSVPLCNPAILRFKTQLYDWSRFTLPVSWLQPRRGGRIALITEIPVLETCVTTYNVHLESRADDRGRSQQMRDVLNDVRSYPTDTPIIVAGDFNTSDGEHSSVLDPLRQAGFEDVMSKYTEPFTTKVGRHERLDWVFIRRLRPVFALVPQIEASDHYPVVVRLALH